MCFQQVPLLYVACSYTHVVRRRDTAAETDMPKVPFPLFQGRQVVLCFTYPVSPCYSQLSGSSRYSPHTIPIAPHG